MMLRVLARPTLKPFLRNTFINSRLLFWSSPYLGFEGKFGRLTIGNFDSIYYTGVSSVTDIFYEDGYRAIGSAATNARGDTIAYENKSIKDLQIGASVRLYESGTTNSSDEEFNFIAYGSLKVSDKLKFAIGFDQNNKNAKGGSDPIIGFSSTYKISGNLTSAILLETSGDVKNIGLTGSYRYGLGNVYGGLTVQDNGNDSGLDLGVGTDYLLSRHARVYAELAQGNDKVSAVGDQTNITLGVRVSW